MRKVIIETHYQAIKTPLSQLVGVLSEKEALKGATLKINDQSSIIIRSVFLKFTLFTKTGGISISNGNDIIRDKKKVSELLGMLGFSDKQDFIQSYFKRPQYQGTLAFIYSWCLVVKENKYI